MLKAVLFDLDGTVTDTEKIYQKYWIQSAHEAGFSEFSSEDALFLRSLNHKDAEVMLHDRFGTNFDFKKVHDNTVKYTIEEISKNGIALKPGLEPLLSYMKLHEIKSAIVTATDKENAIKKMRIAGIENSFDFLISAHDVENGKPHPDPYLFALKELGISQNEAIAVEDAPNGILSAYRAGLPVVMIPDMTKPDFRFISYLYGTVPTLSDLIPLLDDIRKNPDQKQY